jgi:CubicO group peptidase (beta-lactamase class C family)
MHALELIDTWDVPHAAAAVVGPDGPLAERGDGARSFRLASVAKLLAAYAGLVAVEEGSIDLDDPAGPPGATVRHLLAHAAGYGFDGDEPVSAVGRKRIYSNTGIERFADHLATRTGIAYGDYLREAVLAPLGMDHTTLRGSPAFGVWSTLDDLVRFAQELLRPRLIARETLSVATQVHFPGLPGIIPGVGRFDPCDWGLGFELNAGRPGHWTGQRISRRAFGHFGGSGTFLVVDPELDRSVVCLTDREYGPWALAAWPVFCDAVVQELQGVGA